MKNLLLAGLSLAATLVLYLTGLEKMPLFGFLPLLITFGFSLYFWYKSAPVVSKMGGDAWMWNIMTSFLVLGSGIALIMPAKAGGCAIAAAIAALFYLGVWISETVSKGQKA